VTGDPRHPGTPLGTSSEPESADAPVEAVEVGAPDGVPTEPVDDDAVGRLTAERDEYLDALQRLKAEFDNYRKRVERDREAQQKAGIREFVAELLPVIDNLERAVEALGGAGAPIVAGVEMVRGQLTGLLAGRGVEEIAAHASVFDPEVHEAVAQHPTDEHAEGTVVHVAEKGYRLGDTVIRPAKVVVAARPPGQEE
jgi:molecular chaperone GrpE